MVASHLTIIDPDQNRRQEVTKTLWTNERHVEPFDSVAEFQSRWNADTVLAVWDGAELLSRTVSLMKRQGAWIPTIAYCEKPAPEAVVDALRMGAIDYFAWPAKADVLERVDASLASATRDMTRRRRLLAAQTQMERLSPRETQVLTWLSEGLTNKQIARELKISDRTVELHRSNLLKKLGKTRISGAIKVALEANSG